MQDTININGSGAIDLFEKKAALEKILNNTSTKELKSLAELAGNAKAKEYLSNPVKFAMLKKFL